ncbi:MAG TPA: hypothetical protein DCR93_22755 [Cytophagales bacterium]|nr:hypothetical protein [Cytophagales bacterium]HAP62196.1 hypothetical protein [Cytophagales bacterium]
MANNIFRFNKLRRGANPWPFILGALLFLLLLFLLRYCNTPNHFYGNSNPHYGQWPQEPGLRQPIDSTKIIVPPGDSLKRPIISNLLNVYVQDSVDLKVFANQVIYQYPQDSIQVTYYADEYKRIQFQIPAARRDTLKKSLKQDFAVVKFVVFESILNNQQTAQDPGFSDINNHWFYEQIGLYDAWKQTMGKPEVKIAIIDDSFDATHPELINQIDSPWNVFEYSPNLNTYRTLVHGTHVAGTAVGESDNGVGISGVAPRCRLIPIQIADAQGRMTTTSILDGIFYALKNDADVINMSLGLDLAHLVGWLSEQEQEQYANTIFQDEAAMWNEVYEIAQKENTVIVQAAGNSNVVTSLDPMKRSSVTIVVGATDRNQQKAGFSNYGQKVDIYAPGVGIYSSVPNQRFERMDGTSMASPMVAGCVGLIKSVDSTLSATDIIQLMNDTGIPINASGDDKLIQIDEVLQKIQTP